MTAIFPVLVMNLLHAIEHVTRAAGIRLYKAWVECQNRRAIRELENRYGPNWLEKLTR